MAYNQSRIAVLNEEEQLGIRYLRFLRCVTHHLEQNECFQAKLHSLDSGFKTEPDPALASKKLIAALERLESKKNYYNNAKVGQNILLANSQGVVFGDSKHVRSYKIFNWGISLKITKIEEKSKATTKKDVEIKFKDKYYEISQLLDTLSLRTSDLINRKLKFINHKLAFEPQVRIKSWESTVDKLLRLNARFDNLNELQDLIGVRVVSILEKDLPEIERTIDRSFAITKKYTPDYISNKKSAAKHIIVKLKNPESRDTIIAEIQIMTLSQFMFTKVSHQLQYKNIIKNKKEKNVGLNKLSALLDVVDSELERCFDERLN
ncbi:RelA/SpoT domain-containing protein [Aeromonas caviae]